MGRVKGHIHSHLALDNLPMHVRREVIAKRKAGWSYARIRDFLEDVHGENFHENTVTKWLKRRQGTIAHIVYGTPEFKNMVAQEYTKVLTNAREVSDVLVDSIRDLRAISKENIQEGRIKGIKDMNTTATTFLEYFKEIKNVLKDTAGIDDLDVGVGLLDNLRESDGVVAVRKVRPD